MPRVPRIREREELPVRAHLAGEDHVAGFQVPSRGGCLPSADKQRVRTVLSGYCDVAAGNGMLDAEVVEGVPNATGQHDEYNSLPGRGPTAVTRAQAGPPPPRPKEGFGA